MQASKDPNVQRWQNLSAAVGTFVLCFFVLGIVMIGADSASLEGVPMASCPGDGGNYYEPAVDSTVRCVEPAKPAETATAASGWPAPDVPKNAPAEASAPTF